MVNSGSFDSDVDRNEKDGFTQSDRVAESPQSGISMHIVSGSLCENDFTTQTADSLPVSQAIEPTATKTEYKCNMSELFVRPSEILTVQCNSQDISASFEYNKNTTQETYRTIDGINKSCIVDKDEFNNKRARENTEVQTKDSETKVKPSVCCSVPLEKVQNVLKACNTAIGKNNIISTLQNNKQISKKDMCLYCDRTFITSSLKQKHVDRSHSLKCNRRLSTRRQVVKQSVTACMFCDKLNNVECTLRQLFEHLVFEHPKKYFACLECETRFSSFPVFQNHNVKIHGKANESEEEHNSNNLVIQEQNGSIDQNNSNSEKLSKLANIVGRNESIKDESESLELSNAELKTDKRTDKLCNPKRTDKLCNPDSEKELLHSKIINESGTRRTLCLKIKSKCKYKYSDENKKDQDKQKPSSTASIAESARVASNDKSTKWEAIHEDKSYFKRKSKTQWVKELRNKKVSVVSTKVGMRQCLRITRQRSKILENVKTSKRKITNNKTENSNGTNTNITKYLPYQNINPYPSFDVSFRVKKITDHSIDNIRIGSITFDDVFDKAFFNRVKCNIQENLLNYIDGKLFKSVESENRISSFQKSKDVQHEEPYQNCGSKISSNAVAPIATLLTTQFGEDLESQIEYASKPSKKKATPIVDDEVHYKYFTRRKYQAVISENREHRDLSKLDMWTQLVVKNRQQKILSDNKTDKELLEYTKSDEYRVKMQVEELNTILDKRGPLEDLKEEAIRTVALEKLNGTGVGTHIESYFDVTIILNELLNGLFSSDSSDVVRNDTDNHSIVKSTENSEITLQGEEIPNILNLRRVSCSTQEELPENTSLDEPSKTIMVELTGEWARSRIYVCAACGIKMPNAKSLIDHKNLFHEHVWCQHYEFVGNQGELYRHLSIPALGKIGELEENSGNKLWRRSDARMCSKCNKRFNCLGDLHRHVLECGGDWSWMLARKKYKYRPYGSKPRKKRRGLLRFLHTFRERKGDQSREKRKSIKKFTGPRQKPSDADTIQRMLANLPAKRITRKMISLKDGFQRTLKNQKIAKANKSKSLRKQKLQMNKTVNKAPQKNNGRIISSNKSRRLLRSNSTILFENKVNFVLPKLKKETKENNAKRTTVRRHSVRNINKVLANKIMKTNSSKTKCKLANDQAESLQNNEIDNSIRKNNELLNKIADENSPGNKIRDSRKTKTTRFTKQLRQSDTDSKKTSYTTKKCDENKSTCLSIKNKSKGVRCIKRNIASQQTVAANLISEESLQNVPDSVVSIISLHQKINKHEGFVTPIIERPEKDSSLQSNSSELKLSKIKTRQRHSNDHQLTLSVTHSQSKTVKNNKKKSKKSNISENQVNGDTEHYKTVKIIESNSKNKYPCVDGTLKTKIKGTNKNVTSVRMSCRRKNKIISNNAKSTVHKVKSKKRKSGRIKNRITKIVQIDGSSQNIPSTRSKSSRKEFYGSSFLCDHPADHTTLPNNIPQTIKDFSYFPSIDKVVEMHPQKTCNAEITVSSVVSTDTSNVNANSAVENRVENFNSSLSGLVEIKILEDPNLNDIAKTDIENSNNTFTLQDTKEVILNLKNASTTAHTTTKKSTKKQRGLNDCIEMLTNKLQDKGFSNASFKNNEVINPTFSTTDEISNNNTNAALLQHDSVSRQWVDWKTDLDNNSMNSQHQFAVSECSVESIDSSTITINNKDNAKPNILQTKINNLHSKSGSWPSNIGSTEDSANDRENHILECDTNILKNCETELHHNSIIKPQQLNKTKVDASNYRNSDTRELIRYTSDDTGYPSLFTSSCIPTRYLNYKEVESNAVPKANVSPYKTPLMNEINNRNRSYETQYIIQNSPKESLQEECIEETLELTSYTKGIHEKNLNKLEKVKSNHSLKTDISHEQNCDHDNIPTVQTKVCSELHGIKPKVKKKRTNFKTKKSLKTKRNRHHNSENKFQEINNTEEFCSNFVENALESDKNTVNDNVSDVQLMQNFTDNDQEVMFNTSDDFSNSGKENLIVNKIKVSKHRKTKNKIKSKLNNNKKLCKRSVMYKHKENKVESLQPPKMNLSNDPCNVNPSDATEFVDSEDDLPLAQFIKKYINQNVITNKTDNEHIQIQENLDEVVKNQILNSISCSTVQKRCFEEFNSITFNNNQNDADEIKDRLLADESCRSKPRKVKARKQSGLEILTQTQNTENVCKNHIKLTVNKIRRQKNYTKHRKRKSSGIISTKNRNKELIVLQNEINTTNDNFHVQGIVINSIGTDKDTIEDKIYCTDDDSLVKVTTTLDDPVLLVSEVDNACAGNGILCSENKVKVHCQNEEYTKNVKQLNRENENVIDISEKSEYMCKETDKATNDTKCGQNCEVETLSTCACTSVIANVKTILEKTEQEDTNNTTSEKLKLKLSTKDKHISTSKGKPKLKSKLNTHFKSKKVKVNLNLKSKDVSNSNNAFCDICNKTFTRSENLLKHKRTLTHIAKLSELEAFQSLKKCEDEVVTQEKETCVLEENSEMNKKQDLNISNILRNTDPVVHDDFPQNAQLSTFPIAPTQDSLKLVDIINDVLSKPVEDDYLKCNNFSTLILQSEPEIKRYKSLGERKSFDCDTLQLLPNTRTSPTNDLSFSSNFVDTKVPSTADVIVEKQISLLENMIEDNRINFKSSDNMLISSKLPVTEEYSSQSNSSEFSILSSSKQEDCNEITFTHNTNIITNLIKPTLEEDNVIQSTQYEEISEESSSSNFQYEEQKSRKALNRDEELFLECCSLLKSSSDVSDLCKKSTKSTQFLNNFGLKPLDEIEWLEQKQFPQRNVDFESTSNIIIDDSRMTNSISDHFSNELSHSNSSSSNCNLNLKQFLNKNENDNLFSHPPIFEDISTESEDSSGKSVANCFKNFEAVATTINAQNIVNIELDINDRSSPSVESAQIPEEYGKLNEEIGEEKKQIILKFGNIRNGTSKCKPDEDLPKLQDMKVTGSKTTQSSITDFTVLKKKKEEHKKMLTKGAMKVFEGLKVSIPKEDLDMNEVLSCSPTSKRLELKAEQDNINKNKKVCNEKEKITKPSRVSNKTVNNNLGVNKSALKNFGNKLGLKITKKKSAPERKNLFKGKMDDLTETEKKSHDIYDFEETQDSIDVFSKSSNSLPVYHNFRNKLPDKPVSLSKPDSHVEETSQSGLSKINENNSDDVAVVSDEEKSSNSPVTVAPPSKKINMHKSITKKKCMIMGRIFKNAIKSKMSDEIKNIPIVDNSTIVEDYVQNCQNMQSKHDIVSKEHKLSEEEMNILFDNLLNEEKPKHVTIKNKDRNDDGVEYETSVTGSSITVKVFDNKSKSKGNRCKKRQRGSSPGSSDEEFSIKKAPKKQCSRKSSSNNDCVINLEQELKECIGVASRKSQRKCTSGKQNVLVEYWSSDESNFEVESSTVSESTAQNEDHKPTENVTNFLINQENCNANAIVNNEEPRTESAVIPETYTFDVSSSKAKEKKKQSCNEQSKVLTSPLDTNKKLLRTIKTAETVASDHDTVDSETIALRRQKRTAVDTLYYWSSSSEDELQDIIEVKPLREEYDDEDRPLQQGWIVGNSPKKLVTMLAQAKGKKVDMECVKKNRKKRTSV